MFNRAKLNLVTGWLLVIFLLLAVVGLFVLMWKPLLVLLGVVVLAIAAMWAFAI